MLFIPIVQVLIFTLYLWYVVAKHGVLSSISASWYAEGGTQGRGGLFTLFIFALAISGALLANVSVWFFVSGMFLAFVGAATDFKERLTGIVHSVGATLGIVFALVALATQGVWWPAVASALASLLINKRSLGVRNTTWWEEVACVATIAAGELQLGLR